MPPKARKRKATPSRSATPKTAKQPNVPKRDLRTRKPKQTTRSPEVVIATSTTTSHVQTPPAVVTSHVQTLPTVVASQVQTLPTVVPSQVQTLPTVVPSQVQTLPTVVTTQVQTLPTVVTSQVQTLPTVVTSQVQTLPAVAASQTQTLPSVVTSHVQTSPAVISSAPALPPACLDTPENAMAAAILGTSLPIAPGTLSQIPPTFVKPAGHSQVSSASTSASPTIHLPLDSGVSAPMKEKIWADKWVDFRQLLPNQNVAPQYTVSLSDVDASPTLTLASRPTQTKSPLSLDQCAGPRIGPPTHRYLFSHEDHP
ncbi:uncharacterized protein LOC144915115 [Branchiostoma floridae x Branchiostoma belcheri]